MKHKEYDDDDGRTIADMSEVSRQNLILFRRNDKKKDKNAEESIPAENDDPFSDKRERGAFIGGALAAGLTIAAVFIAAGAIVIFLMTHFWG